MHFAKDIARYRENLQGEVDGAVMYRAMADLEAEPSRAELYRRLAAVEESHASFWKARLGDLGVTLDDMRPGWRTKFLIHRSASDQTSYCLHCACSSRLTATTTRPTGIKEYVDAGARALPRARSEVGEFRKPMRHDHLNRKEQQP